MPLEDIPTFLKIPQAERAAAWEARRVAQKALPPEPKLKYRPIPDMPGAKPDDDEA